MARKTQIFGNGLGMALDHRHFSLERALEDVWNHPQHLSADAVVAYAGLTSG
ncbi:hypothetical protein ALQ48_200062 [Pseudomonas coronafaciens pv. zizaniae]|nr:hypothetical protein ALQ48_200062 [Pseudomonas coronafaciens pv. zizaniae]